MKPELLKALQNNSMQWNLIQFHEKDNQKPLEEIKLGFECEEYLNTIENEENTDAMRQYKNNLLTNIRKNCLQFCITAAQEIIKRLPINDKFLIKLQVFKADIALLNDNRETSFYDVSFIAKTIGWFDENGL